MWIWIWNQRSPSESQEWSVDVVAPYCWWHKNTECPKCSQKVLPSQLVKITKLTYLKTYLLVFCLHILGSYIVAEYASWCIFLVHIHMRGATTRIYLLCSAPPALIPVPSRPSSPPVFFSIAVYALEEGGGAAALGSRGGGVHPVWEGRRIRWYLLTALSLSLSSLSLSARLAEIPRWSCSTKAVAPLWDLGALMP